MCCCDRHSFKQGEDQSRSATKLKLWTTALCLRSNSRTKHEVVNRANKTSKQKDCSTCAVQTFERLQRNGKHWRPEPLWSAGKCRAHHAHVPLEWPVVKFVYWSSEPAWGTQIHTSTVSGPQVDQCARNSNLWGDSKAKRLNSAREHRRCREMTAGGEIKRTWLPFGD